MKKKEIFLKSFVITYFVLLQCLFLYFYAKNLELEKEVELFNSVKNELKLVSYQREIWKGYVLAENKKEYKNKLRHELKKLKEKDDYKSRIKYEITFKILHNLK